jgi:predicted esterase
VPPDLTGVDVFISAGRRDPIVEPVNTQRLADMLAAAGARVSLRWTEGGHALTGEDVEAARDWL